MNFRTVAHTQREPFLREALLYDSVTEPEHLRLAIFQVTIPGSNLDLPPHLCQLAS